MMKYQNIIFLLDNKTNQPPKFRTKNWVKIIMTCVERTALVVKLNLNLNLHC